MSETDLLFFKVQNKQSYLLTCLVGGLVISKLLSDAVLPDLLLSPGTRRAESCFESWSTLTNRQTDKRIKLEKILYN